MNLDRLLKLLKLANHNPNDAEANSAARAASKLLGEENYKWLDDAKKNGGRPPANKQGGGGSSVYEEAHTSDLVIRISRLDLYNNHTINNLVRHLQAEINRPAARTWNDVHRSKEPFWRSNRAYENYGFDDGPFSDTGFNWEEFFNREQERQRKTAEARKEESRKAKEKNAQSWTWTGERSGDKGYKKVYVQQCRDCTICKITRLTTD